MLPILAEVSFLMSAVMTLWIVVCVILALIILVQKGKGGGLSGAFGGAGTGGGLLGTKTGDFLTWVTISLVGLFFLLAIVIGIFLNTDDTATEQSMVPLQTQTPAGTDDAGAKAEEAVGDETKEADVETESAEAAAETEKPADDTDNTEKPAETPAQE